MTSLPSLRIAIIGAGNIGSAFAFQLVLRGLHDVTVIARPGSARLQQLQRDGAIVDIHGQRAGVTVSDRLDELVPYDVVIVTVMAHQVDVVIPALRRSAARFILFMFNNFDPERLQTIVGKERCGFGMPFVQAKLNHQGRLKLTIGAGTPKTKLNQQRWADMLNAAGLPSVVEPAMLLWLRCHVPLCVAFESVAVADARRGGGATWSEAMVLARGLRESYLLIEAMGYGVYPSAKSWLKICPYWLPAAMLWTMSRIASFRELLAGGIDECRALTDVMSAAAEQSRHPVVIAHIQAMKPADETPG